MPALVHDGVLLPHPPSSPRQVLTSTPRGVYTTTTVHPTHGVADWTLHQQRIARNALAYDSSEHLVDLLTGPSPFHAPASIRMACEAAWLDNPPSSLVLLLQLYTDEEGQPHMVVHASPAPPPPTPAAAVVVGPPRTAAGIKDCAWATTRQPYEAQVPPTACEGLLCSADGGLTEGLVTNLFVVDNSGTVHTAPEGVVLGGIVRTRVVQTLAALDVPIVEAAPAWRHRHTWTGAFVTNGVRLVQPLTSLTLPPGCTWLPEPDPDTVELAGVEEPITAAVSRTLLQEHTPLTAL